MEKFLEFTRWLARSGDLAKSAHLDAPQYSMPEAIRTLFTDPTWEAALAGALQRAALAAPHGLQLQSFRGWASSSVLLRALSSSHLTQLHLGHLNAVPDSSVADVAAGIAGLTSLQDLSLSRVSSSSDDAAAAPGGAGAYLPALQPLTNLTSLTLHGQLYVQQLHIPDLLQLQFLQLHEQRQARQARREQPLLLGHLGSVTNLQLSGVAVQQGDELPPGLQELKCLDMSSTEPLCGLTCLAKLLVVRATTHAAQLQQLGESVRSLRNVQLWYSFAGHVNRGAAGWAALPLKELSIDTIRSTSYRVRHSTLECLARLQSLTRLDLHGCEFPRTAEWQLAGMLAQLSSLRALRLLRLQFQEAEEVEEEAAGEAGQQQQVAGKPAAAPAAAAAEQGPLAPLAAEAAQANAAAAPVGEPEVAAAAAAAAPGGAVEVQQQPAVPDIVGWQAILCAAAQLPQLQELSFDEPLTAAAAEQLAAATQLQQLRITNPLDEEEEEEQDWVQRSPSELVLIDMLCCLTNLRKLDLEDQPHLGDAAVPVIGRLLTQLTSVSLDNCRRITDSGLAYLTGLRHLVDLSLIGTTATSAAIAVLPGVRVLIG
jgi:hypothetical protein